MNASLCRFVVLISGRGSNMQSIVELVQQKKHAQVCAVIANKPDAAGLKWAQEQGIPTQCVAHKNYASRGLFDEALASVIQEYRPDYVLLAGFMRILTPGFIQTFKNRLINIHPSLLPAFPGLNTHQLALDTGVQWHGCTLHFVTEDLDDGPVLAQGIVPVLSEDTASTLAQRVLEVEHVMYARAVDWLAQGRVTINSNHKVEVKGLDSRAFLWTPTGITPMDKAS